MFRFVFIFIMCVFFINLFSLTSVQAMPIKEKFILEAVVNDYILRMKAKDEFSFIFEFDYWTGVLSEDNIDVFIYVRPPLSIFDDKYFIVEEEIKKQFKVLQEEIIKGIRTTILDFEDFAIFKNHKINVFLRIKKYSSQRLDLYLKKIKD